MITIFYLFKDTISDIYYFYTFITKYYNYLY